ncbi:MAG: hypothetical protein IKH30_12330 [Clostridia bacterium]|nr:hypothetical protein [Clostridia bacterium]
MKEKKSGFLFPFIVLFYTVITVALALLLAVSIIKAVKTRQQWLDKQPPRLNEEYIFSIVQDHADTIMADIQNNDYAQTLALFDGFEKKPDILKEDGCVFFDCYGLGFGPSTVYGGFYYVPWDGPAPVAGIEPPWVGYLSISGEELIQYLELEGNGFIWREKSVSPGGDNEYYTEKICDYFWYYRLDY